MNLAVMGALLMGLTVATGAFGAHGLKAHVGPTELGWWNTAVTYQAWHGLGLLALASLNQRNHSTWVARGGLFLVLGVLVFSGSLYVMTLTGMRILGAVTPVGGLFLIIGGICAAIGLWEQATASPDGH
mgnify:CR=1 FL=1